MAAATRELSLYESQLYNRRSKQQRQLSSRLKPLTILNLRKRRPQTWVACIKSINQFWFSTYYLTSGKGLRTGSLCLPSWQKFSFSRKSNTLDPFLIPLVPLISQNLIILRKTVSWVSLSFRLQCGNNGFFTRGVRAVKVVTIF